MDPLVTMLVISTDREQERTWATHIKKWRAQPKEAVRGVVSRGGATMFAQELLIGPHWMIGDEPLLVGGRDRGPSPYDFPLAALAAYSSITAGT
jgi:hypothetical protein